MRIVLLAVALAAASTATAHAHAVGFGVWRLEERADGRWASELRLSGVDRTPLGWTVEGCSTEESRRELDEGLTTIRGTLSCGDGPGPRIALDGLPEGMRVRVTLQPRLGAERTFVLQAESPEHELEAAAPGVGVRYLELGIVHILVGWDHVAFVLALLALLRLDRRSWRRILSTLSAFTVGHSVTLALAALGALTLAPSTTEAMIAASLVLLAAELATAKRDDAGAEPPSLTRRFPEGVALFFGLFHGLGFAGVLAEIGLPPTEAPLALLAFNGGVEIGQIAIAAAGLGLLWVGRRVGAPDLGAVRRAGAYALGCAAVVIALERFFGA